MKTVGTLHHYNPDWLADDDLVANFIARSEEFAFLRSELARFPLEGNIQHYLLVGVRGAGKTTLLKRLAVAIRRDADLNDHLVALSFPEELYQVKHLADFWWAACAALADELDRAGKTKEADRLLAELDQAKAQADPSDDLGDVGLHLLLATCTELGRRPVLLVDNLDLVFQRIEKTGKKRKNPHAPAYWALREALSTARSPVVIGGSVRLSEPFTDYDKAFYDFFLPKRLGKLPLDEARRVLEHLAQVQGLPEVHERLHAHPGRIQALHELTGGNPRALGFIFELLRQGAGRRAVEDFFRLMDTTTPYYKDRFEDLADQAQVVMHALAVRPPGEGSGLRFGHTAAEIATHAGLPTNTVSTQLEILTREGLVEKSAAHGRTQYRISEQLFRLWLQMRGSRRLRQNVIGLTEFLEALFEPEELRQCLNGDCTSGPLGGARLAFAVAGASGLAPIRSGCLACGTESAFRHAQEQGEALATYYLASEDLPAEQAALARLREQLRSVRDCDLTGEERDGLLGSTGMDLTQKERIVEALSNPATLQEELRRLRDFLTRERSNLLPWGLHAEDIPLLWRKRALGLLPLPYLSPDDAEAACVGEADATTCRAMVWRLLGSRERVRFADEAQAQNWIEWGQVHAHDASATEWANVAGTMRRSKRFSSARIVLDLARTRGSVARVWYEEGVLLEEEGEYAEAEVAYRRAIELDPNDALPWNGLGILLTDKLSRHEEAEAAYRRAIELDPTNALPWYNLGILLTDTLQRHEEAEAAYRRAIELDPTNALPWNGLGILLTDTLQRHEEAEAAYRRAIELDPNDALPWNNLGNLLTDKLQRHEEAEAAYAHGAELEPDMHPYYRNRYLTLQTNRAITAIRQTLDSGATELLHQTLTHWAEQSLDLAAALTSTTFIEDFLAPLLHNTHQAEMVLAALCAQGFDRHARPLLLAFEAALSHRPEMLAELEPEVRGASQRVYERLVPPPQG
jgi:Flp pilus assembly protein TadD